MLSNTILEKITVNKILPEKSSNTQIMHIITAKSLEK